MMGGLYYDQHHVRNAVRQHQNIPTFIDDNDVIRYLIGLKTVANQPVAVEDMFQDEEISNVRMIQPIIRKRSRNEDPDFTRVKKSSMVGFSNAQTVILLKYAQLSWRKRLTKVTRSAKALIGSFPTQAEKDRTRAECAAIGEPITIEQLNNWLSNHRRRTQQKGKHYPNYDQLIAKYDHE
jgi:hypothetical protein